MNRQLLGILQEPIHSAKKETTNISSFPTLFLVTDHPSMAELLFHALGTHYQLTESPHRARDLHWLDHLRTCQPRPAAILLEVDCLWNEEWTTFTRNLGLAIHHHGLTQPLVLLNDYHGNEGNSQWICIRKPFSIAHLRSTLVHLLAQADEHPTISFLPAFSLTANPQRSLL